jgi:type IV pilus assembly protein PilB
LEAEYRSVLVKEDERGEEVLTVDHFGEDQSPVVKLLDTIMLSAMQRRASDIHIEATDRATTVKFRVDGILVSAMDPLDVKLHPPLVSRLKVMSDLDIAERRVPQDGSFRMRLDRKTVDFRVSILPSVFGESVVIRILDREAITTGVSTLRLDRLGFNAGGPQAVPSRHYETLRHGARDRSDRKRKDHDALRRDQRNEHSGR